MRGFKSVGILWTGIEKALVYGINFVQGVILARLLCPEDFGLTAMLGIFLGLGGTLAEMESGGWNGRCSDGMSGRPWAFMPCWRCPRRGAPHGTASRC